MGFSENESQKCPLSYRALYTAYASRNQDVHHRAENFHRRYVLSHHCSKLHRKNVTTMNTSLHFLRSGLRRLGCRQHRVVTRVTPLDYCMLIFFIPGAKSNQYDEIFVEITTNGIFVDYYKDKPYKFISAPIERVFKYQPSNGTFFLGVF